MQPRDAAQRAQKGELLPVYLLLGEERLLRDQALDAIVKGALAGGLAEFNTDKFSAGEADVEKVIGATRTVPMMAKRRVVLVRSVERWDSTKDSGDDDDGKTSSAPLDRLAEYAKEPIDSTCLILLATKLDGRRKLVTLAKKQDFVVECASLNARELPAWIKARAKEKGHAIDGDVAALIAEISGPDLSTLDDVLERLSLYVGAGNEITEAAVSVCVTRVNLADTWNLVDAARAKDLAAILTILGDIDARRQALPLIGAVAWSLRQLLKLESALGSGASIDEAARAAGIYPAFKARDLAKTLKSFRPRELEKWLVYVQEADAAIKSSRRSEDAILEEMFLRMCRRAA